jgi:hypothetical protein
MKKAVLVACTVICVAASGFAATPSPVPLTGEALATILGEPADAGSCATSLSAAVFVAHRPGIAGEKALCTATAQCASGTVSCSSNTSTTSCSSADRNCSIAERGHVTCNGVTTNCPTACSQCDICNATGDCFACCRCDGLFGCARMCSDPFPREP